MVIVLVQFLGLLVAFDAPVLVGGRDSRGGGCHYLRLPLARPNPTPPTGAHFCATTAELEFQKVFPDERTWVPSEL